MHHPTDNASRQPSRREAVLALLGLAGATLLPACGGGTDVAGVSSGGTGSFTSGTVIGLGSVIVQGIRYADDTALITLNGQNVSPGSLQLGMVVRIEGSAITPAATAGALSTATATRIECQSEWRGPVSGVGSVSGGFLLLGQTVRLGSTTVFAGGSAGTLADGQQVEVYGFLDLSDGSLQATRVDILGGTPATYRLSGVVADLDSTRLRLGTAQIDLSTALDKPANLANGMLVRAEIGTSPVSGVWPAVQLSTDDLGPEVEGDEAEIEGTVTTLTSSTAFSVNGILVDASRVGPVASLALGIRVEVHGSLRAGVLVANKVSIEDEEELENREYEFHGSVSSLDTTARTFVIRGYLVGYDSNTSFNLHGAAWADGLTVEVKARLNSAGALLATEIETDV